MRHTVALALIAATFATAAAPRDARADETPGWGYLADGGAIPFLYGSAAVALGLRTFASPPDEPLWFDAGEGGAELKEETVPDLAMISFSAGSTFALTLMHTESRWYHVKGMAESIVTTAALTEIAKNAFGRHRPHYDPVTAGDKKARKSFFSGHSSLTLATTTYAGLYLHKHVFARWRGEGKAFAWWEPIPLGALAAVSVWVPYTRVDDNMHHVSDVLVGAGVGMASSIAFYWWQERRFRRARATGERERETTSPRAMVVPNLEHPGAWLIATF